MKTTILIGALVCLAGASCISPSLEADWRAYEVETELALAELREGKLSEEEFREAQLAARGELQAALEGKVNEAAMALKNTIDTATKGPITGNPLFDLILGAAGAAATAYVGVNARRNQKRRERGEPVEPPPRQAAWQPPTPHPAVPVEAPPGA
jgi:hypothetical protein